MLDFIGVVFLILLNALFVMTEIALLSSKKPRLQQLIDKGSIGAKKALELHDNSVYIISTIQICITSISILSGIIGEKSLIAPTTNFIVNLGLEKELAMTIASVVIIIMLTTLSVIIGEIVPKRMGLLSPEKIISFFAIPINLITKIFYPIVYVLTQLSEFILSMFGLNKEQDTLVSNEEVKELMEVGSSAGIFHETEQEIVANVLQMDEKKVVSIMTHKNDLFYIDIKEDFKRNINKIIHGNHSKVIVIEDDINSILGIVNVVDILSAIHNQEEFDIKQKIQKVLYLPEYVTTTNVLEQFKINKAKLAIIVNEYGENIGLVTLMDLLQSIVGEVMHDQAIEDADIIERSDGTYLVDGLISLDKFAINFDIDELKNNESYYTLAGLIFSLFGTIPKTGYKKEVEYKKYKLYIEVIDMDGNTIDKVLIKTEKIETEMTSV